jgi:putative restriction endonuclease
MPIAVINARTTPSLRPPRAVRLKRIHFEASLEALDSCVLLFAPREDAMAGYYGLATLSGLEPDLAHPGFMFAQLQDFRPFATAVKPSGDGHPFEHEAQGDEGALKWWTYAAGIRFIDETTFAAILAAANPREQSGFDEVVRQFPAPDEPDAPILVSSLRRTRDAKLRMAVLPHYGPGCALSRLRLPAMNGREEVEVCHLRALEYGGSDEIRNAMPMARTVHWAFDNGLIGLENDGTVLFAPAAPPVFRALFYGQRRAVFPRDPNAWPDPESLKFHRNEVFGR